jgi:hypothetical protein
MRKASLDLDDVKIACVCLSPEDMGAYIPPTITTLLVPTKAPKQTKEGT